MSFSFFVLEILAHAAGTPYFASSRYIATTVTQGSFDEGFSFISRYFWQVEGWVGAGLLVLCGAGLLLSPRRGLTKRPAGIPPLAARYLLVVVGLARLGYADVVQFAHGLVFTAARCIFLCPSWCWAQRWRCRKWRAAGRALLLAGGGAALGQFGAFVVAYRAVVYPADVAYVYDIHDARQIAAATTTGCDRNVVTYCLFDPRRRGQATAGRPRYRLVNFVYLYPLSCYVASRPETHRIVAVVPYFMKYTPYHTNSRATAQRVRLQRYGYEFRVVC